MAVVFMDGFDYYNDVTGMAQIYQESPNNGFQGTATGRIGGRSWNSVTNGGIKRYLDAAIGPTWGVATAIYFGGGDCTVCSGFDTGTNQIALNWSATTRVLSVSRNGTTIATGTRVMPVGQWFHVEMKVFMHSSTGTVEVRINGITDINATGLNTMATGNNTVNRISWGITGQAGGNFNIDDIVVWDTSGSINTDFLGDCRIQTLFPTGAGTTTNFTPSTGSNWQNVDDNPYNDDTDYNSTATTSNKDTFATGDLSSTSGAVKAVQSIIRFRKDDAGSHAIRRVIRSSSTDYEGADVSVSNSYVWNREIIEADPATSAAWLISAVNAAEIGYKLQS